ncbi:unnamed protein product [Rhizophagus irregularis]|uniref:Cation efflux protein transmembrane domain-containing protein n=1 Tax=Rhizophagus irregularis TaxID=588596 RepID=A0A2I1GHE6_9GLOM|nr:hypothetical protein RhiirA4_460798 [Rhizophagus irregularis]CAB4431154.1 unnamed protein product [Rhizophagus irregularis]
MEHPRLNDHTETSQTFRPESPRLVEPVSSCIRRSASPSPENHSYEIKRRTLSSLSFQAIPDLVDDSADLGESSNFYEYSDENNHDHRDLHENHFHDIEEEKNGHIIHENYYEDGSYYHNDNIRHLPNLSYIFSSLPSSQKTLFAWGTIHLFLGIFLWLKGQWGCGLALTGFAYLVIFDALGVFTTFISSVIATYRPLRESTIRNPFGVQRYEILFGFINALYLLFVALYMLKEGLEHFMLETSEEHVEGHSPDFPMGWVLLALGATLISAIYYRNHIRFSALLRSASSVIGTRPLNYWQFNDGFTIVLTNLFTLSTLLCGSSVILVGVITEQNHSLGWLDKLVSILESILMFYLAIPVSTALGKILLQTTPDVILISLEDRLREIQLDPTILSLTATHFWENSYGKLVGTICVQVNPDANEQAVLANVYSRLSPLFDGSGELTIQIVK